MGTGPGPGDALGSLPAWEAVLIHSQEDTKVYENKIITIEVMRQNIWAINADVPETLLEVSCNSLRHPYPVTDGLCMKASATLVVITWTCPPKARKGCCLGTQFSTITRSVGPPTCPCHQVSSQRISGNFRRPHKSSLRLLPWEFCALLIAGF